MRSMDEEQTPTVSGDISLIISAVVVSVVALIPAYGADYLGWDYPVWANPVAVVALSQSAIITFGPIRRLFLLRFRGDRTGYEPAPLTGDAKRIADWRRYRGARSEMQRRKRVIDPVAERGDAPSNLID